MTVTTMIPGILEGKIRALYILGEDPVMSDPDSAHIRHCWKPAISSSFRKFSIPKLPHMQMSFCRCQLC